jgi:hypothetical protein
MKVSIKKDFLIETIANEKVLIGNGEQINFSRLVILNDTAAFIITELQNQSQSITVESLAQCLVDQYEVGYDEALADVVELLQELERQGVVVLE